jgi:uncharacterized protein YcfJ
MYKLFSLLLTVLLSLTIISCASSESAKPEATDNTTQNAASNPTYVTMPANTAISVALVDSIDTDVQVSGTDFSATLSRAIIVDGHTLFADGAQARGTLNKIVQSGHLKTPAELNFRLNSIQDKAGHWISVGTDMIVEKKDSHTNKEVAMIGGGAVVGGIIGKIIDRKNSTEIGAVAGAAAGTGLAAATGKKDIFHPAGTEVVFYSSQPLQIALR